LERIAATLRHEVGPAIGDPLAKTQAFMASVVLEKVARQLRLAESHAKADREDLAALVDNFEERLAASAPRQLALALESAHVGDEAALGALVAALYAERHELGPEQFDVLLARVRRTLRARLDRQLEYAS
jgi:hypothetical protein